MMMNLVLTDLITLSFDGNSKYLIIELNDFERHRQLCHDLKVLKYIIIDIFIIYIQGLLHYLIIDSFLKFPF